MKPYLHEVTIYLDKETEYEGEVNHLFEFHGQGILFLSNGITPLHDNRIKEYEGNFSEGKPQW